MLPKGQERPLEHRERERKALLARSRQDKNVEGRVNPGGSVAMALGNQFVKNRSTEPAAAVRIDRLMLAAAEDESKSQARQPGEQKRTEAAPVARDHKETGEVRWRRRAPFRRGTAQFLMPLRNNPPMTSVIGRTWRVHIPRS